MITNIVYYFCRLRIGSTVHTTRSLAFQVPVSCRVICVSVILSFPFQLEHYGLDIVLAVQCVYVRGRQGPSWWESQ